MDDSSGINIEVFSGEAFLISFEFLDGSSDLKYLINGQLLSNHPTVFLASSLSEPDTRILSLINDQDAELQKAVSYTQAYTSLQKELWRLHMSIDKFTRGLRRGRRKNILLSSFLHADLYEGEDEKVKRELGEVLNKIESSLYPLQRIIDVSKYAEVMQHDLRIY
jgi:hypothetical protein